MTTKLLVTGASGQLGRRVVQLLLERTAPSSIVAATRKPETLADFAAKGVDVRRADFEDDASLAAAFAGVSRALLVSTDALDRPGRRLEQHRRAVRAFVAAGVDHVVYTSLPKPFGSPISIAPDHAATEEALTATKLATTFLRNNLYTDLMLHSLPAAVASGKLVDARGTGKVAFVTREDCAQVAATALLEAGSERRTVDVTGGEALTSRDVAAILSNIVGKTIEHVSVRPEDVVAGLVGHGLPEPVAQVYATFDIAIARGDLEEVTDTVKRFKGADPQTVKDFLTANRSALGA